jgi:hypothetical protein
MSHVAAKQLMTSGENDRGEASGAGVLVIRNQALSAFRTLQQAIHAGASSFARHGLWLLKNVLSLLRKPQKDNVVMQRTQVRSGWVISAALSCLSFAVSAVAAAPSSTTASTASEPLRPD